jgi:hypothetical protein
MEKSKKANECRNNLLVVAKVANLPRREFVANPTCIPSSEKRNKNTKEFICRNEVELMPR